MAIEVQMGRWCVASIAQTLAPIAASLNLTFFVEGVDMESKDWFQKDSLVLRVTGPLPVMGIGTTRYKIEAMCMLTDLHNGGQNGFQNHDRLGTITNALCGPIPILKYGGDESQVGCLDIDKDAKEFIRPVHFGKLDKDNEVVQAAVIAKYEICL
jgi:hypothetical protein